MPARKEETVRAVEDAAAVSLPIDGAVGLGVDIVEIARMKKILERTPSFARKVFSCEECCYCEDTAAPEVHFATRFAAKEAVVKALGTGFTRGIGVRDIEVKRSSKGRPYVVLSGRAKQVAKELGVRILMPSRVHWPSRRIPKRRRRSGSIRKPSSRSASRKRARCLTKSMLLQALRLPVMQPRPQASSLGKASSLGASCSGMRLRLRCGRPARDAASTEFTAEGRA